MSKDVEVKRAFEGLYIPREIWLSQDLTLMEKLVLVEIKSLDTHKECFAKNEHFAKFFGVGITRIGIIISSLVKKGYINRQMTYAEGTKHIIKRTITICVRPIPTKVVHTPTKVVHTSPTKVVDPTQQKLRDNTTVNNTKVNNTIIKSVPKENKNSHSLSNDILIVEDIKQKVVKENKPADLLEVEDYFKEKGYDLSEAETFFEYYENIGWKVGRNPMKKWKYAANKWIKNARPKYEDKVKANSMHSHYSKVIKELNEVPDIIPVQEVKLLGELTREQKIAEITRNL